MNTEPLADVRDMYMAHTMYRREIGLAAALIRGVADGDLKRAAVVAEHLDIVETSLDHHHRCEDGHLWERLVDRAGPEAKDVVEVMEEQHEAIEQLLIQTRELSALWRSTADAALGVDLAATTAELHERLVEHLAVEEERALPLLKKHITAAEWKAMIAEGGVGLKPEQMTLIFGLMTYEGDPETVRDIIATMPPEIASAIGDLAGQAFAQHSLRVYGTATPERIGTQSGKMAR
jgi:hemerythrin-like domain-containing protein